MLRDSDTLVRVTCCRCDEQFGMTRERHRVAKRTEQTFYCPNGHKQYFPLGKSDLEQLQEERDRLIEQRDAANEQARRQRKAKEAAQRSASAYKGQTTKLKNRAAAGLCPCCNRSFENLARHMKTKHPDYVKAEDKT